MNPDDLYSSTKQPELKPLDLYTRDGRFNPNLPKATRLALVRDVRRGKRRKLSKFSKPVGTTTLLWDSSTLGTKRGSFP